MQIPLLWQQAAPAADTIAVESTLIGDECGMQSEILPLDAHLAGISSSDEGEAKFQRGEREEEGPPWPLSIIYFKHFIR